MIEYYLSLPEPHTHLIEVRIRIPAADGAVDLVMPSWTPGSYLLREFARNVQDFEADDAAGMPLAWSKVDKNTWRVDARAAPGPITARYRVYANELTVRTSHVDASHAFINGASAFMYVRGAESEAAGLRISCPGGWRVATSLHETETDSFVAADYDDLVDSPIEIGRHRTIAWDQGGIPHRFAVWGADEPDEERLIADTSRVVDVCSNMFGGLPYDRYLFILHVVPGGRGGLEHKYSSALQVPPTWVAREEYESLLALVAHEFFHVWLGKRIRPEPLGPFDYTAENYTRNLWVVEGFTTYYTDLVMLRAGLITPQRYLERLGESIARLQALPGRMHQTLEESSFDAWIKFYRPDAHTPNAQVSYYQKGALVALALDLEMLRASGGERSLDDVMRALWEEYGSRDVGFPEDRSGGIQSIVATVGGAECGALLERYVTTIHEIDFDRHLEAAGLALAHEPVDLVEGSTAGEAEARVIPPVKVAPPGLHETRLGLRVRPEEGGGPLKVTGVLEGQAAQAAGLNVGDELVTIGGRKASMAALRRAIESSEEGDGIGLTVMRRESLMAITLVPGPQQMDRLAHIVPLPEATADQRRVREGWLGR